MGQIGAVVREVVEKLADGALGADRAAVALGEPLERGEGVLQPRAAGQGERFAHEPLERFADAAGPRGVGPTVGAGAAQAQEQVEVAELEHPAVLAGDAAHTGQIVSHEATNAALGCRREGGQRAPPARGALLAREQQGVEEDGAPAPAGTQGGQIQDPGAAGEVKPEPIRQQHERARRQRLGAGPGDEAA